MDAIAPVRVKGFAYQGVVNTAVHRGKPFLRPGVDAVGLLGVAPRLVPSRGHAAGIPHACGLTALTTCALCLPVEGGSAWGGLLFPLPYHVVLVVKVCAHGVRLRPGGRL
ncbi:MAG: hypothetical protein RJA34_652 [Pseudomonadota bacterium]